MIKDIFDIEPIQKNAVVMFLAISCICFLQLYIFKREIFNDNLFISVGLSFAMAICWIIVQLPSFILIFLVSRVNDDKPLKEENVALAFGVFLLFWIIILTYIGYELDLSYKNFIRVVITVMFTRMLFWIVYLIIKNGKKVQKQKNVD